MLHEVLLALSGHPSPLFNDHESLSKNEAPLLSPAERALLQSIGRLSELHRKLKKHIKDVTRHHPSIICRSTAMAIQQTYLARFQDKILDVENKILTRDAAIVGAYNIVPLAGVVGEFDEWRRRMAWYWSIACFMQPPKESTDIATGKESTGAALIDRLRVEQKTGFSDIEDAALSLSRVAEIAWLRQLASWLLYGNLPTYGAADFFIRGTASAEGQGLQFSQCTDLLPAFVPTATALSILFIGKSLHQVRVYSQKAPGPDSLASRQTSDRDLPARHLKHISSLSLPIVSGQLARAVSAIRLSLSQNVLQHLLPMRTAMSMLSCLRHFFLLGKGEFAVALSAEADSRLKARQQSMGYFIQQDPLKAMQGLSVTEAELHQTLSATLKRLASRDEDVEDDYLDFARAHVTFASTRHKDSQISMPNTQPNVLPPISNVVFNDLLFPSATSLSLKISPPLDLLVSPSDIETYSAIHAYLMGIRRAHLRLSDLWRRTSARRDCAALKQSQEPHNSSALAEAKARRAKRRVAARKVWATCRTALLLIAELSAYLEVEVISEAWNHFESWVKAPLGSEDPQGSDIDAGGSKSQHDPETLASAHRAFLGSLTYALLLTDTPHTRELRSLLGNIDHLIAFFDRTLDIQIKLDLEHEAGSTSSYSIEEEQRLSLELDRARKKVDSDLKSVVHRLRQVDHERVGATRYADVGVVEGGFEPCKAGGVDRLLMKLEFGRAAEGGFDIV